MRRSIALFLALLMAFSVAVPAFAEGEPAGDNAITVPDMTEPSTSEATEPPASEVTEPPASEVTEPPASEVTEPPASEATETPLPEATETPLPEVSETPVPEVTETPVPEESAEPSPEASPEPSPEPSPEIMLLSAGAPSSAGQVDLTIEKAMELGGWEPEFVITLAGAIANPKLTAGESKLEQSFTGLAAGEYTLKVTAPGFVTYSQTVEVQAGNAAVLKLTVGQRQGYGDTHPGVLWPGDVDAVDGTITRDDKTRMMEAVDGQLKAAGGLSDNGYTDLNGDGFTTLADAEILAKIATQVGEPILSAVSYYVPESAIQTGTTTDVTLSDMQNMFNDSAAVTTLARTDGEAISDDKPVELVFNMPQDTGAVTQNIILDGTNIDGGTILVEGMDDTIYECPIYPSGTAGISLRAAMDLPMPANVVCQATNNGGNITVDLPGQVAVKKVTIKITKTTPANPTLAEITQVEFLNGMESRITDPATDAPTGVTATAASKEFTVSWTGAVNVTGYELMVGLGDVSEIIPVAGTSFVVTTLNGSDLENFTTYNVSVRSVNGTWRSDWVSTTATPKPTARPDKPDMVTATGGFQMIAVSWKKMKDSEKYNLYYAKESSPENETKVPALTATSFVISGLESETTYVIYVTGENEFGESERSLPASATTTSLDPPDLPLYKLINTSGGANAQGSDHIQSVACVPGSIIVGSAVDTVDGTAMCTVDGNAGSYYERKTWDDGGYNNLNTSIGLTYTFDDTYTIDTIGIMPPEGMNYGYAKIRWWDADGTDHVTERGVVGVESRYDASGKLFYFLRLPTPVTTNKIQIGLSRAWVNNQISVAEVYFYQYDSIKNDIFALYEDALHTVLKPEVTEQTLSELEARINGTDGFGNPHPDRDALLKELETARNILNALNLSKVTLIHDGITPSNDDHGFGGLNAWQPLGVVAAAGEKITVYVGHANRPTGTATSLQLVFTQYHAEANKMHLVYSQSLKVGPNEITIPAIVDRSGIECGGALYVQYTGGAGTGDSYAVRVSGGVQVPVLDLYKVTDPTERLTRVTDYVNALAAYDATVQEKHNDVHQGEHSASAKVDVPYAERDCILESTDIMLDTMMLSIPAKQVLAGCGGSAAKLLGSLDAMEDMMALFYQHKGLNAAAPNAVDQIPRQHLNIRYMRMFSGAFMYAAGNHIGIEWPETAGMAGCGGVTASADGLWQSGNYFGWGIAHEIGHDINQSLYAIAEVTNNYFAVLAQAHDDNASVRFQYPLVYEKVTSGTKGSASNVFTQLGMYWQLHLAYDSGYNFKTYPDYNEQLANLFWARVDTYARTPSRAPGETPLTLDGADRDQALMRLCCAAAQKDLLDFFQRWGKTPDETTVAYASQFDPETRAIYYVNDDARRYTMESGRTSALAADGTTPAIESVAVAVDPNQSNKVDITVTPGANVPANDILGYEIVRCTISGGVAEKRTVGFTTTNTFSDVILAMNNRAVSYEVTLVDKYLNRSAVAEGSAVKIHHEGQLDKSHWTVSAASLDAPSIEIKGTDEDPDAIERTPKVADAVSYVIDGDVNTVYRPTITAEAANIEIDFHETQVITGFKYTAGGGTAVGKYLVYVRQSGEWTEVCSGELGGDQTVYFPSVAEEGKKGYVSTYAADALMLVLKDAVGTEVSIAELDVLGVSGDNVEFHQADETGQASIGKLSAAYEYASGQSIPAGSLVFTGSYKGNAGYNVVVLYDQTGNIVTGYDPGSTPEDGSLVSSQIILAPDPGEGELKDTTDGVWIYWIEPQYMEQNFKLPEQVRVELYRVNNAQTNDGERLVSDTLYVTVPEPLPSITLTGTYTAQASAITLTGANQMQILDSIALG